MIFRAIVCYCIFFVYTLGAFIHSRPKVAESADFKGTLNISLLEMEASVELCWLFQVRSWKKLEEVRFQYCKAGN